MMNSGQWSVAESRKPKTGIPTSIHARVSCPVKDGSHVNGHAECESREGRTGEATHGPPTHAEVAIYHTSGLRQVEVARTMMPEATRSATLGELKELLGATLRGGEAGTVIRGIASVEAAQDGDITWVSEARYAAQVARSKASAVVIDEKSGATPMPALVVRDPAYAALKLLARFEIPQERPAVGVHPTAVVATDAVVDAAAAVGARAWIGSGAKIGAGTRIHPGVFVGSQVQIGRDCELWPNVYVADRTRMGDRVVIKPGAVIGSDGFGFLFRDGGHRRIPQIGIVVLEDDVEIGANACIDRAKFSRTVIGRGTKIDNLSQVAHNCSVGPHCILVAQTGISGSVTLGAGVVVAGQGGTVHDVRVADGVVIGAQSVVTKDIETKGKYLGNPAQPAMQEQRQQAAVRRLPELLTLVRQLTERVAHLEAAMHDRKTD